MTGFFSTTFDSICIALVYTVIDDRQLSQTSTLGREKSAQFLRTSIRNSPDYLSFPLKVIFFAVDFLAVFMFAQRFHKMNAEQRQSFWLFIKKLNIGPIKDFVYLVEGLTLFAALGHKGY